MAVDERDMVDGMMSAAEQEVQRVKNKALAGVTAVGVAAAAAAAHAGRTGIDRARSLPAPSSAKMSRVSLRRIRTVQPVSAAGQRLRSMVARKRPPPERLSIRAIASGEIQWPSCKEQEPGTWA